MVVVFVPFPGTVSDLRLILVNICPGAARYRPCAALLGVPGPRLFRFLPVASGLPDHSPHSRASTNGLRDGALAAGTEAPDSSNSCSAIAHGAPARSEACRSYLLPRRPGSCAGCAETLAGEAPAG